MRILSIFLLVIFACSMSLAAPLPRSTPEEQGVSSAAVLSCIEALDKIDSMNSFMLVRHGHVVAEGWWAPYSAESPHALYSLSKSFTSTAVGMAIAEGKINLSDPVLKFFPDHAPANPSVNLKAMRISDLLRMSTGHQIEPGRTAAGGARHVDIHARPPDMVDCAGVDEDDGLARLFSGEAATENTDEASVLAESSRRLDVAVADEHRLGWHERSRDRVGRINSKPLRQMHDRLGRHHRGGRIAHHSRIGLERYFFDARRSFAQTRH